MNPYGTPYSQPAFAFTNTNTTTANVYPNSNMTSYPSSSSFAFTSTSTSFPSNPSVATPVWVSPNGTAFAYTQSDWRPPAPLPPTNSAQDLHETAVSTLRSTLPDHEHVQHVSETAQFLSANQQTWKSTPSESEVRVHLQRLALAPDTPLSLAPHPFLPLPALKGRWQSLREDAAHMLEHLNDNRRAADGVVKYSTHDTAGWATAMLAANVYKALPVHFDPPDANPTPIRLADHVRRIALVGDLGTLDEHHRATLRHILTVGKADVVVHLGDIYYCGDLLQCEEFWNIYAQTCAELKSNVPMYAVPGNHEYGAGGAGFFLKLLPNLGTREQPQRTSYFCLETSGGVRLIAFNTGVGSSTFDLSNIEARLIHSAGEADEIRSRSAHLSPDQARWAHSLLSESTQGRTKTTKNILLSHHGYYSCFWPSKSNAPNVNFQQHLGPLLPQVSAWYWGHEHRCVVYDTPFCGLVRGRCIGHGAMPEEAVHTGRETNDYRPKNAFYPAPNPRFFPGSQQQPNTSCAFYNHGYCVLQIDGEQVTETFYELPWLPDSGVTFEPKQGATY